MQPPHSSATAHGTVQGADTVALPILVQKQNQEKQSICHCREVGRMIREEK